MSAAGVEGERLLTEVEVRQLEGVCTKLTKVNKGDVNYERSLMKFAKLMGG